MEERNDAHAAPAMGSVSDAVCNYKEDRALHRASKHGECVVSHMASEHGDADVLHHHHSHAEGSHHEHGHHLLTVEHLSLSFRRYAARSDTSLQVTSSTLSAVFSAYSEASATSSSASKKRSWFKRAAAWASAPQVEVEVLRDLSLSVHAGEIVAVVGASGSGKTLLADSLLGLFDPHARVSGTIWFDGVEQTAASLAALRGREIALVPQSVAALDPLMKVGRQVEEVVQGGMRDARDAGMQAAASRNQAAASRNQDATSRALRRQQLFARYGLSEDVANLYPHELSGGMLRRVLLCCALMQNPRLIVADEPTPGLDLKRAVQALADLRDFANEGGGVVLITHDISLALTVADRVAVFKDGTVVEETAVANFASPNTLRHPFTRALWHALPENDFCVVEEGAATCDTVSNSEESERNKSLNGDDVVCSYAPSAEEGADSKASNTEEGAPC